MPVVTVFRENNFYMNLNVIPVDSSVSADAGCIPTNVTVRGKIINVNE